MADELNRRQVLMLISAILGIPSSLIAIHEYTSTNPSSSETSGSSSSRDSGDDIQNTSDRTHENGEQNVENQSSSETTDQNSSNSEEETDESIETEESGTGDSSETTESSETESSTETNESTNEKDGPNVEMITETRDMKNQELWRGYHSLSDSESSALLQPLLDDLRGTYDSVAANPDGLFNDDGGDWEVHMIRFRYEVPEHGSYQDLQNPEAKFFMYPPSSQTFWYDRWYPKDEELVLNLIEGSESQGSLLRHLFL